METRKNIIRSFLSNVGYYKESTIGDIKEFFKSVKYKGIFAQQQLGHSSVDTTVNNYANGSYGMKDILANM